MKEKLPFIAALAAGVIVVAAVAFFCLRPEANSADLPTGVTFLCTNKTSPHDFTLTTRELGAWQQEHYGQQVLCPTCGQPAQRALKCPHCGTVSVMARALEVCPKCKQPFPPGKQ